MTGPAEPARGGYGWQIILADLALILFLLTLAALNSTDAKGAPPEGQAQPASATDIAAAQALFRPVAGGPTMREWLAAQPRDPRATLTVFARHRPGEEAAIWARAQALVWEARASGVAVRTIIQAGTQSDLYASLAYDAPAYAELR